MTEMAEFAENRKVLYVDDEENLLFSFRSLVRNQKAEVYTLSDSTMIEEFLESNGPFAVVFSDQRMPGKDGVAVLREVASVSPDTMRVLVTGYADMEAVKGAINDGGIIQYISKPWEDNEVRLIVSDLVGRYNVEAERRFLLSELKRKNETLQLLLEGTVTGVVKILSDVAASVGEEVAGQNLRVKKLGQAILKMMPEISQKENWEINQALELFNLGLAFLPPLVQFRINKEGIGITNRDPVAKDHHLLAAYLLKDIPRFEGVANILLLMQKQFNGEGEPCQNRAKGRDLPLGSRILRILIDLDSLSKGNFRGRKVLEQMKKRTEFYDVDLIDRLLDVKPTRLKERKEARLPINLLSVGMVLLQDLVTVGGQQILRKNSTLTETACKLLSQWGTIDPISSPVYVRLNEEED